MRISLNYEEGFPPTNDEDVGMGVIRSKIYESDVLDKDIIDSPKGKNVERFIIDDLQITMKSDVDAVIEMLKNVKNSLSR